MKGAQPMILVTGADGYIGWPLVLALADALPGEVIYGVDELKRRAWTIEAGADSLVPIASMERRLSAAKNMGWTNIHCATSNLADLTSCLELLKLLQPDVIVHLAAQPSAPYAQLSAAHAAFTQHNNVAATRNLLWALHDLGLSERTHFVETTTMGIYGASPIPVPEGELTVRHSRRRYELPFPAMATSWYHMSKAMDSCNLRLASAQWGQWISELRTAIVFGTGTSLSRADEELATRFDGDYFFGVVANRFTAQAVADLPLTVYGKGEQTKPFIALEDAVTSLVSAVKLQRPSRSPPYTVFNQVTEVWSILELAQMVAKTASQRNVACTVLRRPNPRLENETHRLEVDRRRFLRELLPGSHADPAQVFSDSMGDLLTHGQRIRSFRRQIGEARA